MRKALIVGIDHYSHIQALTGCVNDAHAVKNVLERHADGTINFANPRLMTATGGSNTIVKGDLKDAVRELFDGDMDIALFYFAGHGYIEDTGGYLCTTECKRGDDGLTLAEVMALASGSKATNKVIILDSCHSGVAGNSQHGAGLAEIIQGMTILTASAENQYAMEVEGGGAGVFTTLLVDALNGSAANLLGEITPGSLYAHIDQSLGPWGQRPVFKTNVQSFVSLRKAVPPIPLTDIQALPTLFPRADYDYPLDPSYEPERNQEQKDDPDVPAPDPEKNEIFARLQRYARVNLVRPVNAPHMWHAAIHSKSCELTVLGQHYRKLVADGLI
jgi:hypothetical protein